MKHAKPIAAMLLAGIMLPPAVGAAQEQPGKTPQAQEERAANAGQPRHQGAKAAQQTRKPTRRRSVQQIIGPLPTPAPTAAYGPTLGPAPAAASGPTLMPGPAATYGPTLATAPTARYGPALAPPAPIAAIPAPAAFPVAPGPAPLNSCIGNHCTDASGNTYNAGIGNAAVNSQGRLCNRVGNTVQCF
jgi:hypothetical protein